MRNLLLCMAGATFALGSSVARGHGEHAVAPLEQMDCSRPPAAAITQLPEPLANWARLECGAGGQKLVAAPGWQWRYPSSWFDRPFAPAGAPDASIDEPGAKYFVEMTVEVVTGAAAQAVHDKLARAISSYADAYERAPARFYRVKAENNLGHDMEFWFPAKSETDLWGVLCVPTCRPDYAFLIQKQQP